MTQTSVAVTGVFKEEVIIVYNGIELKFPLSEAQVTLADTDADIFEAITALLVKENSPIANLSTLYKIHRSHDTGKLFIIPQSVAGMPFK